MKLAAKRLSTVKEYYFSSKLREVRALAAAGKPIINMGIGSPDLAPSAPIVNALTQAINFQGAHQYQSYQGLPALREAIAQFYHSKFGVELNSAHEVLPLMGSKEGIMHISMAFLDEGDGVLIPNPGYPTYASVTQLVGGVPIYYNLTEANHWFPDLEALEQQDLSKVKLMWLGYPHMPTGAVANADQLHALVAFAKKHEILLVNDNPYSFVLNESPISILSIAGAKEVALELNSLSKTFNMAGWRVGMVLGKQAFIDCVLKVKSNMDSGMFYGIQQGAIAALQSSEHWFDELNAVYGKRKELVLQLADKLGCTYDRHSAGMFVWARLPEGINDAELYINEILYDKSIFITPGTVFGSNGEGYIRFSLCVPEEKIKEAIARF